jgi:hypothetical protein
MLAGSGCQPGFAGGVVVLASTVWSRSDGLGRRGRGSAVRRPLA